MKIKRKKIKFRNQNDVEYLIKWLPPPPKENADGLFDDPTSKNPQIWIDPDLKERRKLKVLIEEVTHAHFWDKSEKDVRKLASNLSKLIIKARYRLKD